MRLSQQTRNAIRVLIFCAEQTDRVCRISDIASACKITEFNTFKLVPVLVQSQFLNSIRGRYGGVKLALLPREISIGAVVRATEEITPQQNPLTRKPCEKSKDNSELFENMIEDAFEAFLVALDKYTIDDFLANKHLEQIHSISSRNKKQHSETSPALCVPVIR